MFLFEKPWKCTPHRNWFHIVLFVYIFYVAMSCFVGQFLPVIVFQGSGDSDCCIVLENITPLHKPICGFIPFIWHPHSVYTPEHDILWEEMVTQLKFMYGNLLFLLHIIWKHLGKIKVVNNSSSLRGKVRYRIFEENKNKTYVYMFYKQLLSL